MHTFVLLYRLILYINSTVIWIKLGILRKSPITHTRDTFEKQCFLWSLTRRSFLRRVQNSGWHLDAAILPPPPTHPIPRGTILFQVWELEVAAIHIFSNRRFQSWRLSAQEGASRGWPAPKAKTLREHGVRFPVSAEKSPEHTLRNWFRHWVWSWRKEFGG